MNTHDAGTAPRLPQKSLPPLPNLLHPSLVSAGSLTKRVMLTDHAFRERQENAEGRPGSLAARALARSQSAGGEAGCSRRTHGISM
jgi:hypothetical protein